MSRSVSGRMENAKKEKAHVESRYARMGTHVVGRRKTVRRRQWKPCESALVRRGHGGRTRVEDGRVGPGDVDPFPEVRMPGLLFVAVYPAARFEGEQESQAQKDDV